jgi:Domain of unknown function (DUF4157)
MDYHRRVQQQITDDRALILQKQAFKTNLLQTSHFGVQQSSVASAPSNKSELWENYQQAKQLTQQADNRLTSPSQTQSFPIQTKLTIGQPGDKYEQEADSVADRVMAMSAAPAQLQREELSEEEEELQMKPLAGTISSLVQREALPEEELQMKSVDNSIQREELPEEEELQMKQSAPSTQTATPDLESQLSSSKGGGSPLSDDVRSFMEPRFEADFSGVRVHTGSDAVQMNQGVNAQAFAHGSDIYFGLGKAPGKDSLTANELTHVVQQTGQIQRQPIPSTPKPIDKLQDIPQSIRSKLSVLDAAVPPVLIESQFNTYANAIKNKTTITTVSFSATPIHSNSVPSDRILRKGLEMVLYFLKNSVSPSLEDNTTASVEIKSAFGIFRFTNVTIASKQNLLIEKVASLPQSTTQNNFAADKASFETKYQSSGFKLSTSWSTAEIQKLDEGLFQTSTSARSKIAGCTFDRKFAPQGSQGESGHYDPNTHTVAIFQKAIDDSAIRFGLHNILEMVLNHEVGHATAEKSSAQLMNKFKEAARLDGVVADITGTRRNAGGKTLTLRGGITGYSNTDFSEYYAEAFSLYSLDPTTLQLIRPNIFKFFKAQFP